MRRAREMNNAGIPSGGREVPRKTEELEFRDASDFGGPFTGCPDSPTPNNPPISRSVSEIVASYFLRPLVTSSSRPVLFCLDFWDVSSRWAGRDAFAPRSVSARRGRLTPLVQRTTAVSASAVFISKLD